MQAIKINNKISYVPASDDPLSADIGIIKDNGSLWLYDVGDNENTAADPGADCCIVLSHFHADHTGNLEKLSAGTVFVSKETYQHTHRGTIVDSCITLGNLRIFPLPSSHAKGCLGLEIDGTYAFVGDALYCKGKNGRYFYNAQLLKDEISVLKKLEASYLLVSHFPGLVRSKDEVIEELERIYSSRTRNEIEIPVTFD